MTSPSPARRRPDGVLEVQRWPRTEYGEAHRRQEELLEQRIRGDIADQLLLTEHDPVITLGRGADPAQFAQLSLPVVQVERGGDATYHGPGQLVAYPILALPEDRRDLHRHLRELEEVVIGVLDEVDVAGVRKPGLTGVWIGEKKVCSIGVAVRRWVTWHGFALNLATDLAAFAQFKPCGLDPSVMTNVAEHVELPPTRLLFEVLVVKHMCRVFELELPTPPPPSSDGPLALPIWPG